MNKTKWWMDSAWVAFSRLWITAGAVVINVLIAHLLMREDVGRYFLLLSVAGALSTFAQLGLGPTATRGVAAARARGIPGEVTGIVRAVLVWGLLGSAFGACAAFVLGAWLSFGLLMAVLLALCVLAQTWQSLGAELLRGFQDIRGATLFGELAGSLALFTLLFLTWAIWRDTSLRVVLLLAVSATLLAAVLGLLRLRTFLPQAQAIRPARLFTESSPVLVTQLVWMFRTHADIWILSAVRPPAEVALYGVATRLAALLTAPQNIAKSVLAPSITEIHNQRRWRELQRMLRGSAAVAGGLAMLGMLTYLLLGRWFLGTFYGTVYSKGAGALAVLAVGQAVGVCSGLSATTLIMTGHAQRVMWISTVCTAVSLTACLLLAPRWGVLGASVAMAMGTLLQNCSAWVACRYTLGIWTHAGMVRSDANG